MIEFRCEERGLSFDIDVELKSIKEGKKKSVVYKSKSDMFRFLYDSGVDVSEISKIFGSNYSFVYGVISGSREIRKKEGECKSDVIRRLYKEGKKVGEISKELNSNYSFVFGVVKKYKKELEKIEDNKGVVENV